MRQPSSQKASVVLFGFAPELITITQPPPGRRSFDGSALQSLAVEEVLINQVPGRRRNLSGTYLPMLCPCEHPCSAGDSCLVVPNSHSSLGPPHGSTLCPGAKEHMIPKMAQQSRALCSALCPSRCGVMCSLLSLWGIAAPRQPPAYF